MATFVYNSSNVTVTSCNGVEINTPQTTHAASNVIGAQVGITSMNASDLDAVLLNPVELKFSFNTVVNGSSYRCVYWNFSDP